MLRYLLSALCVIAIVGVTLPSAADTVRLEALHDATIYQDVVLNANGAGMGLFAGVTGANSPRRGLISFDIAGHVPAGSTITSVELTMVLGRTPPGGPTTSTIGLFSLTSSWSEGAAGAGSTEIAGTGQGFPSGPGDVTWNNRINPTTPWTAPGGDHVATASATAVVGTVLDVASTWSSAQLTADVQSWLDAPESNFGWLLKNLDETTPQNVRVFYTREWSVEGQRPQLLIGYMAPVPVPAAAVLFGTGVAGLVTLARRRLTMDMMR